MAMSLDAHCIPTDRADDDSGCRTTHDSTVPRLDRRTGSYRCARAGPAETIGKPGAIDSSRDVEVGRPLYGFSYTGLNPHVNSSAPGSRNFSQSSPGGP